MLPLSGAFFFWLIYSLWTSPAERVLQDHEFAEFFESDFPFITTVVNADTLGPTVPERNTAVRGLVLRLGPEAYAVFDTDLLRMAAAWVGDSLELNAMPHISYRDAFNKGNQIPRLHTTPVFATGIYPGWMPGTPRFEDSRPETFYAPEVGRGPISEQIGRWNGLYVVDQQVVLSYTAGETDIAEWPGSLQHGEHLVFTRTFESASTTRPLTLVIAEVPDGQAEVIREGLVTIRHDARPGVHTHVGVAGLPEGAGLEFVDDRYLTLTLPAGLDAERFRVLIHEGETETPIEDLLDEPVEMPDFDRGGPTRWGEAVVSQGKVSPDTSAFVVDQLSLPIPNPWRRNVRVAGVDFFSDGRAAVVTYDGDVWTVAGIDQGLQHIEWRRFASGLYAPMSLQIVDDTVYTFGRDQITRLHDLNGDGEADFYENFSNLAIQTIESREFALDMVKKPGGGFYLAKGGATDNGPRTSPAVMSGFRAGSKHSGRVLEVSADGRQIEIFADGFREPYLGIHPETGLLTATDQQGHFVPSTPIYTVREGGYYGVPATTTQADPPPAERPLTWIPLKADRSAAGQVWAMTERMGPLNGALVHLSYGEPGAFRVFVGDETQQGGLVRIPAAFTAPAQKGSVNPNDGQLYIVGFQIWDSDAMEVTGLSRLRYTGRPTVMPVDLQAEARGVLLRFDRELDAIVTDPGRYQVVRWNYQRTGQYGSGYFLLDGEPGQDSVFVAGVTRSDDGRAVFLSVPDMQDVMQMEVGYRLQTADGRPLNGTVYLTVNEQRALDLTAEGFDEDELDLLASAAPPPRLRNQPTVAVEAASVEEGARIFEQFGCGACHAVDAMMEGKTGPPFEDLYGSEVALTDGRTVLVDEAYLRKAILDPAAEIVEGYSVGMASYQGVLSEAQIASLILYIKTL